MTEYASARFELERPAEIVRYSDALLEILGHEDPQRLYWSTTSEDNQGRILAANIRSIWRPLTLLSYLGVSNDVIRLSREPTGLIVEAVSYTSDIDRLKLERLIRKAASLGRPSVADRSQVTSGKDRYTERMRQMREEQQRREEKLRGRVRAGN